MSNPIGNSGNVQAPGVGSAQGNSGAAASSSVGSGFSADNSVSHVGAPSARGSDGVLLDNPADSPLNSRNYLAQAVQTKLAALQAVVALNNDLRTDEIDLSDTQNLLLALRATLNDIKVLSGAATLDIRSLQFQQTQQMVRNTPAKVNAIRQDIANIQSQIEQKKSQISTYENNNASESSIEPLRAELAGLEARKRSQETRITAREALAIISSGNDRILRDLLVTPVRTSSKASLHTGEEELDELKQELQMLANRFAKDDVRAVLASQILAEFNRNLAREADRHSPVVPEKAASPSLQTATDVLPPQLVQNLSRFLLAQKTPPESSAISKAQAPSEQAINDAAEGLALVIAAGVDSTAPDKPEPEENTVSPGDQPAVSAVNVSPSDRPTVSTTKATNAVSEENPVDQPVLGDNLSLEGANNPQTFTLLLLKERMADIEEALSKNLDGPMVVDSVGARQLAQLLEQEQKIDAMVAEALKDSERSEEAIRRASKA